MKNKPGSPEYALEYQTRRLAAEIDRIRGVKSDAMHLSRCRAKCAELRAQNAELKRENKLLHKLLEKDVEKVLP